MLAGDNISHLSAIRVHDLVVGVLPFERDGRNVHFCESTMKGKEKLHFGCIIEKKNLLSKAKDFLYRSFHERLHVLSCTKASEIAKNFVYNYFSYSEDGVTHLYTCVHV